MRKRASDGPLSVHAIAGSYVVLLGMDMDQENTRGLLGFAIERTDHTEDERYWLKGFKTFEDTDPGLPPGSPTSTLEQPLQAFLWGDYTAKPDHRYTYRVVAMRGKPKKLIQGESVEVEISTEDDDLGAHAVYFNRGVAGSQAYARRFRNKRPDEIPNREAWVWLSRGLEEALLAFVGKASGERYGLRASLYEFRYPPVLKAFSQARRSGANVRIVFDAKANSDESPRNGNLAAIARARIKGITEPREANPSFISHNKFVVLLEDGEPKEVWTGSTNVTDGGIFGHSNVGHLVRDPEVAARYLDYWEELAKDPEARGLRPLVEEATPVPEGESPADSTTVVFSPRSSLEALEWYASRMDAARSAVFLTAAFGISETLEEVLVRDREHLRYLLLEKEDEDMEILRRDPDNRFAVGGVIGSDNAFGRWLEEQPVAELNTHVKYVHTKYALIDPLGGDPVVITGSANFSDASTKSNDENMLVIRGDTRVADLYLTEFMRLFYHFYFRYVVDQEANRASDPSARYLTPDEGWLSDYYRKGSPRQKERLYFAGS